MPKSQSFLCNRSTSPGFNILQIPATGAFQISIDDLTRVHQATVCRVVKRVSVSLARKEHYFVNFPTREHLCEIMGHFF